MSRRAQTFTLEAFVAAILLLGAIAFSLQVVSISANTAGAGDAEIQAQHAGLAQGVLDESIADGSLEETLLYWDEDNGTFYDADDEDEGFYVARHPPSDNLSGDPGFGESLGAMFDNRQVRYNVDLYFEGEGGERAHQPLVESGTPSNDAVRVTRTVTLYADSEILNESGTRTAELDELEAEEFYAPNVRDDSQLYNVIRVEVTIWQT